MTWAMRRRLLIIGLIAAVLAAALTGFYYGAIHQGPSCMDNKQDQGEEGIDCGGPCSYVCTESQAAPSVRFVRPLAAGTGRTDVIAYVDNPNTAVAARALPFTVEVYGDNNEVLAHIEGKVDLPPASTVPIFIPSAYVGTASVARAFLTFGTPAHFWFRTANVGIRPAVENIVLTPGSAPRITAVAVNPSTSLLKDVVFIVTVFNADGNAIAASRTVAPQIASQGRVPLIFTWNAPFAGGVSRIEVMPAIPLPPGTP